MINNLRIKDTEVESNRLFTIDNSELFDISNINKEIKRKIAMEFLENWYKMLLNCSEVTCNNCKFCIDGECKGILDLGLDKERFVYRAKLAANIVTSGDMRIRHITKLDAIKIIKSKIDYLKNGNIGTENREYFEALCIAVDALKENENKD